MKNLVYKEGPFHPPLNLKLAFELAQPKNYTGPTSFPKVGTWFG